MTRVSRPSLIALACLFAYGCGQEPLKPVAKYNAPHGGSLFEFPNKKGSVEITVAPPEKDAVGVSTKNASQIEAYFFQLDGVTPLSPQPTEVSLALGDATPIPLAPKDLPEKSGRFASQPGSYPGEIRGVLSAKVGGEPIEVSFTKR
jgi:hypothetical protein